MEPINSIWTEKYRPKKVSEMVGDFKHKILKYLKDESSIPHFLFYSKVPGTGKTSLSKAIINELECDALILNSSDDRKIDVIRDKVKEFAITQSTKKGKRRCVFLDEFDGMLKASQDALRNVMETYAKNVFFILTCNNINKVIDPLKSRCQIVPFSFPKKNEINNYLKMICENENMKYNEEGINEIVNMQYPSIRNCVLVLQDLKTEELDVIPQNVKPANELFEQLYKKLKEKDWKNIKNELLSTSIDSREFNKYIWQREMDSEEFNLKLIQLSCKNERDIALGADPNVIVATSLIEMVK